MPGKVLGIAGQDPSDSKSNRLHVRHLPVLLYNTILNIMGVPKLQKLILWPNGNMGTCLATCLGVHA